MTDLGTDTHILALLDSASHMTWHDTTAVDEHGVEDGLLEQPLLEPIVKMAVAPNGRLLACFARDGKLAVMSSTFSTKVLK